MLKFEEIMGKVGEALNTPVELPEIGMAAVSKLAISGVALATSALVAMTLTVGSAEARPNKKQGKPANIPAEVLALKGAVAKMCKAAGKPMKPLVAPKECGKPYICEPNKVCVARGPLEHGCRTVKLVDQITELYIAPLDPAPDMYNIIGSTPMIVIDSLDRKPGVPNETRQIEAKKGEGSNSLFVAWSAAHPYDRNPLEKAKVFVVKCDDGEQFIAIEGGWAGP